MAHRSVKKTRSPFWALLFVVSAACIVLHCGDGRLKSAKALLESGDFLAARAIYDRLATANPNDFAAHYGLGMTWCAEAIYKTEIGLADPDDWYPAVYQMTVASHLQSNAQVRRTLAILHFNLGACYKEMGEPQEAIRRIQDAVSYDSTLLKGYNLLGALYQDQGQFDNAENCYRRTLTLKPDYPMAHFNLGALSWSRGDFSAAEQHFRDAAALEPQNAYFQSWLAKAHAAAGGR